MDYCMIRAAASMAPYFMFKVLKLLLLGTLVRCVRFYMLENTELVNETRMKRVVLNSQPAECLGECTHFYGCKSFNVFYDEFGRLTCNLYAIQDGTLESSPLTMHFTLNAYAFKSPTTTQNGITTLQVNPTTQNTVSFTSSTVIQTTETPSTTQETTGVVEESIIIVNQDGEDWHCVSSSLKWISKDDENTDCQQFFFLNGGALKLPNGHCTKTSGVILEFASTPSCDILTFDDTVKQFQYTENQQFCIRFYNSSESFGPRKDKCYHAYQYYKENTT